MTDTGIQWLPITGYTDRWSAAPGEPIQFYVSSDAAHYRAELVQLVHGDTNPTGPGFKERRIDSSIDGEYAGHPQKIHSGSYVVVPDRAPLRLGSFSLQCWIWPTMVTKVPGYWKPEAQAIIAKWSDGQGYGLFLDEEGHLVLRVNGSTVRSPHPVRDHAWHFVAATYDEATGRAVLHHEPQVTYALDPQAPPVEAMLTETVRDPGVPLMIGAHGLRWDDGPQARSSVPAGLLVGGHYNGKIDSPRVCSRALDRLELEIMKRGASPELDERRGPGPTAALGASLVASWDFGEGISTRTAPDKGPYKLHGDVVNAPTRAMTGHNWRGVETNWTKAPGEYGAISFHDDDLDDARWQSSFTLTIPDDMKSAVYAVKLTDQNREEDYIPFFVKPHLGAPTAKIALLLPTTSYMAYANEHAATNAGGAELIVYRTPIMQRENMFLAEHREYGSSQYDSHTDGSGVCMSSRLRPILSVRPKYDQYVTQAPWQFNADLHLVDWLVEMGYDFDVITDEDLSYDGLERIEGYNVVLTGTHPEHVDGAILDALQAYKDRGGRLMYMGGDGFYWVHSFHPAYERGAITEMRRAEQGIRTWRAEPGEYYHQTTGELGGMWRYRGRQIGAMAGTNMASQGFDVSTYYSRTPDSLDPRISWAFEGIDYSARLGDFGLVGGGAAGSEIDYIDTLLGSPPHTLLVASSAGRHSDAYLLVTEHFGVNQPGLGGTDNPRIRADIAYHETPHGGAVFATSSISYCGSLSHDNYDNNISRLTRNVLDRFMQDGPLPEPPAEAIIPRGRGAYDPELNYQRPEELQQTQPGTVLDGRRG
jgi:N,N-dimethylformamidase